MVSAFAAGRRLVLGQVKVAEKSNDTNRPGCRLFLQLGGSIAQKVIDKKADCRSARAAAQAGRQVESETYDVVRPGQMLDATTH